MPPAGSRRARLGRMSGAPLPIPVSIDSDGVDVLRITWQDRHVSRFDIVELRRACTCAQCTELRESGAVVWPRAGAPEQLRIDRAELSGAYGLNIHWNDRHETGIYSWEMLRARCPCDDCRATAG